MEAARLYLMTPEQYYFYNKKHYERAETPMHSPREPLLPAVDDIATDHMNEHRVFSRSTNKEFKFITVENELQMYTYLIRQFQTHLDKLKALEVRVSNNAVDQSNAILDCASTSKWSSLSHQNGAHLQS